MHIYAVCLIALAELVSSTACRKPYASPSSMSSTSTSRRQATVDAAPGGEPTLSRMDPLCRDRPRCSISDRRPAGSPGASDVVVVRLAAPVDVLHSTKNTAIDASTGCHGQPAIYYWPWTAKRNGAPTTPAQPRSLSRGPRLPFTTSNFCLTTLARSSTLPFSFRKGESKPTPDTSGQSWATRAAPRENAVPYLHPGRGRPVNPF